MRRLISAINIGVIAAAAAGVSLVATSAFAAVTPTLSLSSAGNGSVEITVSADPNAAVMFYYNVASASGMQLTTLGTTNSSGYFSDTISGSSYNVIAGDSVYVVVDGAQSGMQAWPAITGTPSLSQTNVTIGLGQSATITSEGSSAAVYMASNSSPTVASITTNGQQIIVTAIQTGSTAATICYSGTASNCAPLNITVGSGSVLSLTQNNITLAIGQGTSVAVSGGSGTYSITSNSDPSVISAVLSGNNIAVTAEEAGSANVSICDGSGNCDTLYVTAGTNSTTGSIYFDNSDPSIAIGGVLTVNASGGSGYYVTENTNLSVASPSVNGSQITISGLATGTATITVCSSANGCGSIYATIGGGSTSGSISFGVTNPQVSVGQSFTTSLSGASSYFVSSNSNSGVVEASVSGNSLVLYGESAGSTSVTVCASSGGCNTLNVTVENSSTGTTVTTTTTSPSSILAAVQSVQTQLSQILSQIQSMEATLTALTASVSGTAQTSGTTSVSASGPAPYTFTQLLTVGDTDTEVTELQDWLTKLGFYSGPVTGYFGVETQTAVEAFQDAHGIDQVGYVGPSTRAALNAAE